MSVEPSGTDDTLAIATAFDNCLAVGPECTVQLSAGTFFTRQQHVVGFQGTFAGAGMEATVIEPSHARDRSNLGFVDRKGASLRRRSG